jgi:hypothetical protein
MTVRCCDASSCCEWRAAFPRQKASIAQSFSRVTDRILPSTLSLPEKSAMPCASTTRQAPGLTAVGVAGLAEAAWAFTSSPPRCDLLAVAGIHESDGAGLRDREDCPCGRRSTGELVAVDGAPVSSLRSRTTIRSFKLV